MTLLLSLLLAAGALSDGGGRIKGAVTGPDRKPVAAVHVVARVDLEDRQVIFLTTTDEAGQYVFEGLPAGTYVVETEGEGLERKRYDDVRVRPPFRSILDFRLEAAPARPPAEDPGLPPPVPGTAPPAAASGPVGEVFGFVEGEGGEPLPDAEIAFVGGPPPGRWLVLSRSDGRLDLPDLPEAVYRLAVTAPGSIPMLVSDVEVRAGRPLELQVRLVDYPVRMAARSKVILPEEAPLPPRRWLEIPPPPALPPAPDPAPPE